MSIFSRVLFVAALLALGAGNRAAATEAIAPHLQPFVDDHVLAGAVVLVADKERVLDLEAVGYSDVAAGKLMKTDDLFWIASMSKPITAVAFMMLVEEGKVSLDDSVEKYLPEFREVMVADKKDKKAVPRKPVSPLLLRHLLSLSGGMRFSSELEKPALDQGSLAERVQSYARMPLDFDPGTNYQYSNASINTVARIIEVVTGQPFAEFLDQRLFQPLGMKDTTFLPSPSQLARLAKSYKGNKAKSDIEETPIDQLSYPLNDPRRQPVPAGGLFSTAEDISRFARMILNGGTLDGRRYLSEARVRQMTAKQTPASVDQGYGFGFRTDGKTFGHFGKYSTNMSINTDNGLVLIFMVQNAGWRNDEGKKISPAFSSAALKMFGRHSTLSGTRDR